MANSLCKKIIAAGILAFAIGPGAMAEEASLPSADSYEIAPAGAPNKDARSVFVNLPKGVLEFLPRSERNDMLAYFTADSIWKAPNAFGGESELQAATRDYVKVRVSAVATLEIKMLPYKGNELVMTIYTIGDDTTAGDSDIEFYTPELTKLDRAKFFNLPSLKDFLDIPKGSSESFKELEQIVAFPTYIFSVSPEGTDLRGELSVGKYMTEENYAILKPYIRKDGVSYCWNGNRFIPAGKNKD